MTISSTLRKAGPYIGSGAASTFPFSFKVFTKNDLKVVRLQVATSTETVLALDTNYTAILNADQNSNPGGSITLVGGNLAAGYNLVITSNVLSLQETDLTNQGGFYPEVINDALDKSIIQIQQLQDAVNRSIKLSTTNVIGDTEFTENAADRASKVLGFDSAGELTVAQELGQFQGNWTPGNGYVQRDIVKDASNFNVYICMVAHTATGTTPLSANAQIGNWQLLVDAAAAGVSATAAAGSAAAANTSAIAAQSAQTTAVAAKDAALASQAVAQAAATGATASQTAAQASQTAAATSQSSAAASAAASATSASQAAAAAGGGAIKITSTDAIADYLINKIVPGTDIFITRQNIGANENITISAPYAVAYAIALGG